MFDTPACFAAVESIWKPILGNTCRPPASCDAHDAPDVDLPPLDEVAKLDLLAITGAELRAATQRTSTHTACGCDGWRRDELLALPLMHTLGFSGGCLAGYGCWCYLAPLSCHGRYLVDPQTGKCRLLERPW